MDHECVKIFFHKRHCNSDLHEFVPAVCFSGFYVYIVSIRGKTEETEPSVGAQWIEELLEDYSQAFILCHGRPHDVVVIWHIVAEKGSVKEFGALLFMFFRLSADRFFS